MNLDFTNKHILVIGDSMIDNFIYGSSVRLSPEAPVPVVRPEREDKNLGGAANVVGNLIALGAKASLITLVGDDTEGQVFNALLNSIKPASYYVHVCNSRKTTTKSRLLVDNQQIVRIDREETEDISVEDQEKIILQLTKLLEENSYDAVILQDYNKGLFTTSLIKTAIRLIKERNIPILVDPKEKNFYAYNGCDIFKPNIKELRSILKEEIPITKASLDASVSKVRECIDCGTIIVTLSEKGAYYNNRTKSCIISTNPLESIDVSGAGDTFISIFCVMFLNHYPIDKCLEISNIVAGIACSKPNVVTVNAQEVKNHLRS